MSDFIKINEINQIETNNEKKRSPFFHDKNGSLMIRNGVEEVVVSGSYIKLKALIRDEHGSDWNDLIEFDNLDGKRRELEIPRGDLLDLKELKKWLVNEGFPVVDLNYKLLQEYLIGSNPDERITGLCKSGWVEGQGLQFVCPSFQCPDSGETYRLKDSFESGFAIQGTLQEWQDNVETYCHDNPVLIFSLCEALSGIILKFVPEINTTIFNFVGKSSIGKTTALKVACSVWGSQRFLQNWRTTSNALEAVAESHNDTLLVLDELSQSSAKDISETFYMLGNSRGKSRMKADSTLRKAKTWRLMILSSGEVGIADKIEEGGRKAKAGQLVRAIDIYANVGEYGIFNNLHGLLTGAELADLLNQNTNKYYGIVAEEFIKKLIEDITETELTNAIQDNFDNEKQRIRKKFDLDDAHGQIQRVANVFALVGTTGILAVNREEKEDNIFQKITQEEIQESIDFVFGRWLSERGKGAIEESNIIDKLLDWTFQNDARFHNWDYPNSKVLNALGYKKTKPTGDKIYYVVSEPFEKEFCKSVVGISYKVVRAILIGKGIMEVCDNGRAPNVTLPDNSRQRMVTLHLK